MSVGADEDGGALVVCPVFDGGEGARLVVRGDVGEWGGGWGDEDEVAAAEGFVEASAAVEGGVGDAGAGEGVGAAGAG